MADDRNLEVGNFYWVMPVNDPDAQSEWEAGVQPARFAGYAADGVRLFWNCLSIEGTSDWPMKWIGSKIVEKS